MAILQDPRADGLTSATDVSFHYKQRVAWLIAGVIVLALGAVFLGNPAGGDALPQAAWITILVIAAQLVVVLLAAADMPPRVSAVLRWIALVLGILAAAHFGDTANLKGQARSIVEIELAGNSDAWKACDCDPAFTTAVQQDFWFIASYVVLLVLLASWAGAFFRLPALRRARTTVVIAVVVAGVFDVAENILMLNAGSSNRPWQFVAVCAWAKFTLLLVAIAYIAAGAFAWWSTPRWVRRASWALPEYARKVAGMPPKAAPSEAVAQAPEGTQMERYAPPPGEARYGIALSGGGIRASSISLGALQELDGEVLGWSGARAVTAVSGGSNMAAGWSISRSSFPTDEETVERSLLQGQAPLPWQQQDNGWLTVEERHLVDNLGYLGSNQPRGSDTDPAAAKTTRQAGPEGSQTSTKASYRPAVFATVIAGLTVNVVVLVSMLWAITRPVGWGLRSLTEESGELPKDAMHKLVKDHSLSMPGIIFLVAGFVVLMLWVLAGQFLVGYAQSNKWARVTLQTLKRASYSALALGALLALILWGFVELVGAVAYLSLPTLVATVGASAGVVGSVVRILRKPAARFAPMLGGIAFAVGGLGVTALATWTAAKHEVTWSGHDLVSWQSGWNWVLALALLTIVLLGPSSESWSLAPFYRGKLRLAYATYRTASAGAELRVQPYENDAPGTNDANHEPGLFEFNYDDKAVRTPLVVCTTSTVTSRAVRTRYGTPALSVTFDPERTILHLPQDGRGNTLQFAASTRVLDRLGQKLHKRITTMMAVAISSAAVSPAMGRYQIGPTSMLLAFFNIRLGVWIANPRFITQLEAANLANEPNLAYPRTGLGYLFKEFFGIHDLDDPYLYLTDGGHWENTGLVELLRIPEITEIVCVDADSGPGDATSSLGKAIAIAPSECDIRIDISLDPLRATPSTSRVPAYSPRTVNIGFFSKGAGSFTAQTPVGVLWYAKPGLAKEMPAALLAFHERYPTYPRESTLNQFFDTASFVAYRNFGRYNARQILRARRKLEEALDVLLKIPDDTALDDELKAMAVHPDGHWAITELSRAAHSAATFNTATAAPLIRAYCQAVKTSLVTAP